ncbi:trypsin-like peptidase domain-containing protein [Streptomyces sp. V4-01]|uniref:Trypsin-like peptidase domain-containing protein n=1 Tax=Actinacidiphila polyblastidii TaxID=3110430 RepID=A0ABU7PB83_9ACTN|nr:trypsin-like peptidase domain-containing protein [Streptomyces sp. V4-01]
MTDEEDAYGQLLGSGFFVAPGKVLTCAHVVGGLERLRVRVGDRSLPATVITASQPGRDASGGDPPWPLPDLALLDVPAAGDVQVAWLDTAPGPRTWDTGKLMSCGFDMKGISTVPTVGSRAYTGGGIRQAPDGRLEVVELAGESVPLYRSGSMVWDPDTGRVVAVLKAARAEDDGLGGYAIPLVTWLSRALEPEVYEALMSAHDRFHARDRAWPAAAGRGGVQAEWAGEVRARPLLEAALLGLIADVRSQIPPGEIDDVVGPLLRVYVQPGAQVPLRRAAQLLAGLVSPSATYLHDALRLVEELSVAFGDRLGADWVRSAAQWAERCADELGQTTLLRAYRHQRERRTVTAPDRADPVLRVHVQPDLRPRRGWELSIRLHYPDGQVTPVLVSEKPLQTAALWRLLREELQRFIAGLRGTETVLLDLILPMDLQDLPVHAWPTTENRESIPIGHRLPVVVRAQERWQQPDYQRSRAALRTRWQRSAHRPDLPIHWVMCEDAGPAWLLQTGADGEDLEREGARYDMLGVTNPPGARFRRTDRLIRAGVTLGLPALIWPTGGCGVDHDSPHAAGSRCSGQNFREQFHDVLGAAPLAELPRRMMALRRSGTAPVADRVVLFWDDPAQACDDGELHEPTAPRS